MVRYWKSLIQSLHYKCRLTLCRAVCCLSPWSRRLSSSHGAPIASSSAERTIWCESSVMFLHSFITISMYIHHTCSQVRNAVIKQPIFCLSRWQSCIIPWDECAHTPVLLCSWHAVWLLSVLSFLSFAQGGDPPTVPQSNSSCWPDPCHALILENNIMHCFSFMLVCYA